MTMGLRLHCVHHNNGRTLVHLQEFVIVRLWQTPISLSPLQVIVIARLPT